MAEVILETVTKIYPGGVQAVREMNLHIHDREFLVLVGPSGCGKSTLLRMVAGLETANSGTIRIGQRVVNDVPPKDRDIAMVFQNYALYPHMSVYKNMAFGLILRKLPKAEIDQRVRAAAKILGIEHLLERRPKALSGGQLQRVAVGRAIVRQPQAFLFDEPLSNLDAKLRVEMRAELKRLHRQIQTTTIYVTHDQEEALSVSDRIVVMNQGKVEQIGTSSQIYNYPQNEFVAKFVGQINLLPVEIVNLARGLVKVGGQMVQTNQTLDHMNSHTICLAVRPEELNPGYKEGENNLQGKVTTVTYLGPVIRVRVEVENRPISIDMFNERRLQIPTVGQPFEFSFHPDACWLL